MSYRDSAAYREYEMGINDAGYGQYVRFHNMPPFEENERGEVIITAGEVFCRFKMPDGTLCNKTSRYQDSTALLRHVRRVHQRVAATKVTPNFHLERDRIIKFYQDLLATTKAETGARTETRKENANARVESTSDQPLDCKVGRGSVMVPTSRMKSLIGFKGDCLPCIQKNRACPPEQAMDCRIWEIIQGKQTFQRLDDRPNLLFCSTNGKYRNIKKESTETLLSSDNPGEDELPPTASITGFEKSDSGPVSSMTEDYKEACGKCAEYLREQGANETENPFSMALVVEQARENVVAKHSNDKAASDKRKRSSSESTNLFAMTFMAEKVWEKVLKERTAKAKRLRRH